MNDNIATALGLLGIVIAALLGAGLIVFVITLQVLVYLAPLGLLALGCYWVFS